MPEAKQSKEAPKKDATAFITDFLMGGVSAAISKSKFTKAQ
jgi:hypothetical protein